MKDHSYILGRRGHPIRQSRDVIVLGALLAVGVVVWGYFFHVRIVDGEDVSLRGPLLHLATDTLLALPPALLATLVGLWLAQRFITASRQGHLLVLSGILVSLAFFVVMAPFLPLHGLIDSAILGEWEAHHGAADDGLLDLVFHALRDAFLISLAVVLPLSLVGLVLLALADSAGHRARGAGRPVREMAVSPQVGASWYFDRNVSRREVLRYGGAGAAALALSTSGLLSWPELAHMLSIGQLASPTVTPFTLPLKIPPVIQPLRRNVQSKDFCDDSELRKAEERLRDEGFSNVDLSEADFYELKQQVAEAQILPAPLPKTRIWGYNGITPGPTFKVNKFRPVVVRQVNQLPVRTATHPHGLDVPSTSDGHPVHLLAPAEKFARGLGSGEFRGCGEEPDEEDFRTFHQEFQDHCYPNIQEAATLWYHDHAIHRTGRNVYMGLAGLYLISDEEEQNLPLPRGHFDIPLVLQDRLFAEDGSLIFPCDGDRPLRQGVFGDVILVNGVPMPFLEVQRRKYRFRFLNGSNARVYRLALKVEGSALSTDEPFTVIASDGGLLHNPVTIPSTTTKDLLISMSERYEVVIDFNKYPIGTQLILENRREPLFGDPIDPEKTRQIMRFDVVAEAADDSGPIPTVLRPRSFAEELRESDAVITRDFRFERKGGFWTINGEIFDEKVNAAEPELEDTEIWRFINSSGGWVHPVHVHLVQFRVLDRNGRAPREEEFDRKDSVLLGPNEVIRTVMKFEHFRGDYVIHCHNIDHEDHDMMVQFEVK